MKIHISGPKIIFFILALCATTMVFTSSFFNTLYDQTFYADEFNKLGNQIKVTEPDIKTQAIISYFSNQETGPMYQSEVVFTDKQMTIEEISHLEDVKILIQKAKTVYFSTFSLFFLLIFGFGSSLFMKYKGKAILKEKFTLFFVKLQVYILLLTTAVLALFGIISAFLFDKFFILFHNVLFPQGNWTFPADSLLISLYPKMFFSDFMLNMLTVVAKFMALLAILLGIIYVSYVLRRPKDVQEKHKDKITETIIGKQFKKNPDIKEDF